MTNIEALWSLGRLLSCIVLVAVFQAISGQIHYSIPEELQKGSFVGQITKDLGIDLKQLSSGAVQIITEGRIQYFALNFQNGHLYINERIDREEICRRLLTCLIKMEILVQKQLRIYTAEIEIEDINDNAPTFKVEKLQLNIPESTPLGSRFLLPDAQDPDLGINSLQSYQVSPNRYFILDVQLTASGTKYAELVLQESMDREEEAFHDLILIASDGGIPAKSGTVHIKVVVEDANDNVPVFSQSVYKVAVTENLPIDSLLITINATDLDEGINSDITYTFRQISEKASKIFNLDPKTGEVRLRQNMDFEESAEYEIEVQARDGRGLSDRANILLTVTDVNDNAPEIAITSLINIVSEDSPVGTAIALLKVVDRDSGENGIVICSILGNPPFHLQKTFDSYYSLVTDRALDREETSDYNVTITATDKGVPPLSTTTIIPLKILDKNDNAPTFKEKSYISFISENIPAGKSIIKLKATDPDWEENARIMYSIVEGNMKGSLLTSFLSINSETGVVYALRSFDYEEIQEIRFLVKAQDGGSPPLSSNVSVTLFILDENDNAPEILYPSPPTDGSTGIELAPRSSEPGYLVTKVVAVDADSGQNSWLSYHLTKATEPGLFTLGLHTGEIRTSRFLMEKDTLKQSLVVLVKDNGQPPFSASVTVTVVLAESIPDMLTDLSNISVPVDHPSDLTFYLVVAVAFVSCLFLTFLLVLLAIKLHRWRNSHPCENGSMNFSGVPVSQFVGIDGVRAFLQSYCHEVSMTSGSRRSQIIFPIGSCTNTLTPQQAPSNPDPLLITDEPNNFLGDATGNQQAQPNTDWRFSQAQRPGTSGSQNGEENGTWPNNQFDTEMLQAMILASANEAAAAAAANPDGNSTLGGGAVAGTMGLSTRYGPQFTLQHVPDYRQNVYIPGSTATLSNAAGKRDGKPAASGGGNKKKSGKKEKK
nr:protocadherin gamma-A10-like isoform X27 [Anolis sagrei ordinatus]